MASFHVTKELTVSLPYNDWLAQVEYAMESVSHAGCVIGILAPGDAGTHLGKELSTVWLACFISSKSCTDQNRDA